MEEWLRKYGVELLDWGEDTNDMVRYFYYRLSYVYDFIEYIYNNYDGNNEPGDNYLTKDKVGMIMNGSVKPAEMSCYDLEE
jgi:hypothetical protein